MCFHTHVIHNILQNPAVVAASAAAAAAVASRGIVGFHFCSCAVVVVAVVPPSCGFLGAILNAVLSVGTMSNTLLSVFAETGY